MKSDIHMQEKDPTCCTGAPTQNVRIFFMQWETSRDSNLFFKIYFKLFKNYLKFLVLFIEKCILFCTNRWSVSDIIQAAT